MLTLEQRRRHNKRITKAFGEGRNGVLYCAALQLEIRDPTLQTLANQFRLTALLGG